jgi:hypothetical protein
VVILGCGGSVIDHRRKVTILRYSVDKSQQCDFDVIGLCLGDVLIGVCNLSGF